MTTAAGRQGPLPRAAWLLPPVVAFVLVRLLLSVAVLSEGLSPLRAGSWCRFDCAHYVRIAVSGYELAPCAAESEAGLWCGNAAWFPGYPLVIRAARAVLPAPRHAAVLVAGIFACLTLVILWTALAPPGGADRGPWAPGDRVSAVAALALAAFFPGGLYAHVISPIGLYGCATVVSLLAAARGKVVAAGVAAAVAALTYPPGVLLVPVLAAGFVLEGRGPYFTRLGRAALGAGLACLGLVAVLAIQHHDTGSWWAYALVQSGYHNSPQIPTSTLAERITPLFRAPFEGLAEAPAAQTLFVLVIIASAVVAAARPARDGRFVAGGAFVELYVGAAWLLPLIVGEVEGGLHRREATLLPVVLLTARLPAFWQVLLAVVAAALTWPMARLFFRGLLI
jgi:hypothetical protein